MTIEHPCRFCGKVCVMKDCCPDGIKAFSMMRLLKVLCCERCGRYRKSRKFLLEKIQRTAVNTIPLIHRRDAKARSSMEELHSALKAQFAQFSRVINQYYDVTPVPHEDFYDQVVEKPNLVLVILSAYERAVDRQATEEAESQLL
jgi:hypothetical protein